VVNYASSAAAAEAVVEEIRACGGDGVAVQADMSSMDGIKSLFKATAEAYEDPVEVLVNNAGITRDTLAMRM
jgi:3-oxoacyl-[acyl-carrier protein] reductase